MSDDLELLERWSKSNSNQRLSEVKGVVERLFADRVSEREGTSHLLRIDVPELKGELKACQFGFLNIVVEGGNSVKPIYIRNVYKAAKLLNLPTQPVEP